jgi:hypothetical protein
MFMSGPVVQHQVEALRVGVVQADLLVKVSQFPSPDLAALAIGDLSGARIDDGDQSRPGVSRWSIVRPVLAAAIVAARRFASVDDLARVPGIGAKRLAAVREWCVV